MEADCFLHCSSDGEEMNIDGDETKSSERTATMTMQITAYGSDKKKVETLELNS